MESPGLSGVSNIRHLIRRRQETHSRVGRCSEEAGGKQELC